ncbi:MAG: 30S ribosomal protein S2 [Rickettsia sp.]|nr:30S ribosomal protein S2 [Rickettsia sp.]
MVLKTSLPEIKISDLYSSSVHLGHKTSRWNPSMAPYIYSIKNNIHIIDLQKTYVLLKKALLKIYETISQNKKILFVSSRTNVSQIVAEYAEKCGQFYISHRWLGGILTNWKTVSSSIKKLEKMEEILRNKDLAGKYTKKEILNLERKKDKLLKSFQGIRNMNGKPSLIIVFDTNKDHLAIKEAQKLKIPIIAILDTNSNPKAIDFPIPGNDDSMKSIKYFCENFVQTSLNSIKQSLIESGVDLVKDLEDVDAIKNISAQKDNENRIKNISDKKENKKQVN